MVEPGRCGSTASLQLKSAHKRSGLTESALLATFYFYQKGPYYCALNFIQNTFLCKKNRNIENN